MSEFKNKMSNGWYKFFARIDDFDLFWYLGDRHGTFRPSSWVRDLRFYLRSDGFYPNRREHLFSAFSATYDDYDEERLVILKGRLSHSNWPNVEIKFGSSVQISLSNEVSPKWGNNSRDLLIGKLFGDYFDSSFGGGSSSGAVCVECGVFNEYALSSSGYICGSCRSYRRMYG